MFETVGGGNSASCGNARATGNASPFEKRVDELEEDRRAVDSLQFKVSNVMCAVWVLRSKPGEPEPHLDLSVIAENVSGATHDTRFKGACVIHTEDATLRVYAQGMLVVLGCKSDTESIVAARGFTRVLRELFPKHAFGMYNFRVYNMTASTKLPFRVNLNQLEHRGIANNFLNECFGGVFLMPGFAAAPKVKMTVFVNGVVNFQGATRPDAFKLVLSKVADQLIACKIPPKERPQSQTPRGGGGDGGDSGGGGGGAPSTLVSPRGEGPGLGPGGDLDDLGDIDDEFNTFLPASAIPGNDAGPA